MANIYWPSGLLSQALPLKARVRVTGVEEPERSSFRVVDDWKLMGKWKLLICSLLCEKPVLIMCN